MHDAWLLTSGEEGAGGKAAIRQDTRHLGGPDGGIFRDEATFTADQLGELADELDQARLVTSDYGSGARFPSTVVGIPQPTLIEDQGRLRMVFPKGWGQPLPE